MRLYLAYNDHSRVAFDLVPRTLCLASGHVNVGYT